MPYGVVLKDEPNILKDERPTPACHATQTISGHSAETKGIAGRSNIERRTSNNDVAPLFKLF